MKTSIKHYDNDDHHLQNQEYTSTTFSIVVVLSYKNTSSAFPMAVKLKQNLLNTGEWKAVFLALEKRNYEQ